MTKYPMRSRQLTEFTVGALASLTAQLNATRIDGARLNGCNIRKMKYSMNYLGKTSGANEGPLVYGVSLAMTTAEIATFFASDPQSRMDEVELEESQKKILVLGVIGQAATTAPLSGETAGLKNAKWPFGDIIEGATWQHFVFNLNPANALTTGMLFQLYTEVYGDWLRD